MGYLRQAVLVRERGKITKPGSGRPGIGIVLNPQGAFFIGASIESQQLTVIELNLAAQIEQRIQEPLANCYDPKLVLKRLIRLINRICQLNLLSSQRL